jgi:hypothetical protein
MTTKTGTEAGIRNGVLKRFLRDFPRVFVAPRALYREMAAGRASASWLCVLLYCAAYEVGVLWLYFAGFTPFVEPWLKIPEADYYLVEAFFILPLVFLVWILAAGLLHVLSRTLFGGTGRFETILVMTGYSLWAPWYPLILADSIHATPEWLYNTMLGACAALLVFETALVVRIEERTGWGGALLSALVTAAAAGLILFTYIR